MKDELMENAELLVDQFDEIAEGQPMDVVALSMLIFVTEFIAEVATTKTEAMKGLDGFTRDVQAALNQYFADQKSH
jgi:hypothetical protein